MRGLYRLQAQMHEAVWKFSGPMRLPDRLSISWRVIYSDLGGTTALIGRIGLRGGPNPRLRNPRATYR